MEQLSDRTEMERSVRKSVDNLKTLNNQNGYDTKFFLGPEDVIDKKLQIRVYHLSRIGVKYQT